MYGFGSGLMYFTRTDVSNPTPRKIGVLQEIQVDFSGEIKELFGQYQFPVDVARGKVKIECKAKFAQISGRVFSDAFFGVTPTNGAETVVTGENHSVPGTSAYTVTVSNTTGFVDLGVRYHNTQVPLTLVASAPTTGQYTVAAGVYTFATGDAGVSMDFDYSYTAATGGLVIPISNQLMGSAPRFSTVLSQNYEGKAWTLTLNSCVSNKLSLPTKVDDYVINEFDFEAFADASNTVGQLVINDLV